VPIKWQQYYSFLFIYPDSCRDNAGYVLRARYAQLASSATTAPALISVDSRGVTERDMREPLNKVAISYTNISRAANIRSAIAGFILSDADRLPFAKCTNERVAPHVGQGIPVKALNMHDGINSSTGRNRTAINASRAIVP